MGLFLPGGGRGEILYTIARLESRICPCCRAYEKVYPEEIGEGMVSSLKESANKKGLAQVSAVLGRSDDPCLPAGSIDLAYMNRVYHHFAKPREMLRGIRRSLKPGGYLVIVDQRRGALRDWVPRHEREEKHYWIAETTVVREAREDGFAFFACPDFGTKMNPLSSSFGVQRRQIEPKTVEEEMSQAGFRLWFRGPRLAHDRFLLVFGLDN